MTPHNSAKIDEIASTVLMPGDPDRARYIAENFLDTPKLVSLVRGIPCYTGKYKTKDVSVMASGMGGSSIGIYSYELFNFYNVENIIRIGTCGGYKDELEVGDLIIALTSSTDSGWAHQYQLKGTFSPVCSYNLLKNVLKSVDILNYRHFCGMVLSSDMFSSYNGLGEDSWKEWAAMGALAQDMETYTLYCNAMKANKQAISILTMTDNCYNGKCFEDSKRMIGNRKMIITALEAISNGI